MKIILIVICTFVFICLKSEINACTGVYLKHKNKIFYAGNEDYRLPIFTKVWFTPGNSNSMEPKYGTIKFGFDDVGPQIIINEKGLCFDGFAVVNKPLLKNKNKPNSTAQDIYGILEKCETIEEVEEIWYGFYHSWLIRSQILFMDRFGNSVIIEGDTALYNNGEYQICTNYYQSDSTGIFPCYRYEYADNKLKNIDDNVSTEILLKNILNYCSLENTVFSVLYNFTEGTIEVFQEGDYKNSITLNISEELKKGKRVTTLAELFRTTDLKEKDEIQPDEFFLKQNYPNPFNPETTISYVLKSEDEVLLKIYNSTGEEVITLVDKYQLAGSYKVKFDASRLSSGTYIYQLKTKNFTDAKKMLLLK